MSETFSVGEREGGKILAQHFEKLVETLKNQGKMNPNHVKDMKKFNTIYNYANKSFYNVNEIDRITRGTKERKEFLQKNSGFNSDTLDEVWFDLFINAVLRWYWVIEVSLISLLKEIQYGKRKKDGSPILVAGTENLGKLKIILNGLGVAKHIEWDIIDITFRNALAHGWYYRKNQNFVYFKNSNLTKGKGTLLNRSKFIRKCRNIQLYGLIIVAVVGGWKDSNDEGFTPIKKMKR